MHRHRTRLWLDLGASLLAGGAALPAQGAAGCAPITDRMQGGETGEAGEGGEGGAPSPTAARRVLDRMAAQFTAAAECRALRDTEIAEFLVGAATDDGPARLLRQGAADPRLEEALAPLAVAPLDPHAKAAGSALVSHVQLAASDPSR